EFAEHLALPVAHSQIAKGVLPDDHPLCLGLTGFWGTRYVNDKCREADLILALGTRFTESDSSSWDPRFTFSIPDTRLIQIDIDPAEIGRNYPVELGAVADLAPALEVLARVARRMLPGGMKKPERAAEIARERGAFAAEHAAHATDEAWPMRPERILATVRELVPRDAIITTDTGWSKNGVAQQFPVLVPGTVLTPGGFATMGFGPPAALGAKIALPDRVVVSLAGDGAFGQNPSVLATAVEEGAAVVWIVMNNASFGTIAGLQQAHFGTTVGTKFERDGKPYSADFAAMAESYGALGIKAQSAAGFRAALQQALASGRPSLIDVEMQDVSVPTAGHWDINDIYSMGTYSMATAPNTQAG
ncbi:thiamine pyrophosphate-binding protein, partial [Devosia sp.]|uniref:thiamine pyrophosphate-binding protein n=1 Tax=Devosia sp. TaxID=1871048 RepID=UPI002EE79FC1